MSALPVWAACRVASVDREHVEHDQHHLDAPLAVQHSIAEPREAGEAVAAEADEFAVDRETIRQGGEFRDEAGHVPATATPDAQVAVPRDERAEPIPFGLEGVVAARRQAAGAKEHRFGEPHTPSLATTRHTPVPARA